MAPQTLENDKSDHQFESINTGYGAVFKLGKLSIGLTCPIEAYPHSAEPTMDSHLQRVQLAESLGFSAVWIRDVPFNVPSFGDAGQLYDPFVYLGLLAGSTSRIALGTASVILPLRHSAHTAKAAASVDALSNGRLIMGVASGDRPEEYPALNIPFNDRGQRFSESYSYIRKLSEPFPRHESDLGHLAGQMDMLPKPVAKRIPMLVTGGSQQNPTWIAENADGWMVYPRDIDSQARVVDQWRKELSDVGRTPLPIMQPLYIDLAVDPAAPPKPLHLGFRSGVRALRDYLKALEHVGVNHVALNLRFNNADLDTTLQRLADELLIYFS